MSHAVVRLKRTCVALLVPALAGCNQAALLERVGPAESQQFVKSLLNGFATAPTDAITGHFTPRLRQEAGVVDSVRSVQRHFGAVGAVDSVKLVGGHALVRSGSPGVRRDLAFEVYGSRGLALVQVGLIETDTLRQVDAFHFEPLPAPLAQVNGFWRNLGIVQLPVLAAALAAAGFSLWVAIQVARTPMRRRWVWVLVALVGAGKFAVNWTTGEFSTSMLSLQLFGASILRAAPVGPWLVAFSFPVGAVIALRKRRQVLAALRSEPATVSSSEGAPSA